MRNRVLLSAGAIALLAASCAQPEPQVLSEAPRSASAAELTSPSQTTEEEAQPGRFIARCATEADGGTPGMTFFTDGSQNVTDHCLSRYYIGVQPAPGALYVPDADAGSLAPTRENPVSETTDSYQWTPAQPRTDAGPEGVTDEDRDQLEGEETTSETDDPDSESTTPTPGETTPGTGNPGETETSPTAPGSSEPGRPTEVPTTTGAQQSRPAAPPTSVESAGPTGPFGSLGSHGSHAPVPR